MHVINAGEFQKLALIFWKMKKILDLKLNFYKIRINFVTRKFWFALLKCSFIFL